jgi:TonB-linked SusC/RagA family outer membrane protein
MEINLTSVFSFNRRKLLQIIMRAYIFLICVGVFGLSPNNVLSQIVKIEIKEDKVVTVDELFSIITDQTEYSFIYQSDLFKDLPTVKITKGFVPANELLQKSLDLREFNFLLSNNTISITKKSINQLANKQESFIITGSVRDENGTPLIGATVMANKEEIDKNANASSFLIRGTSTDFDGNFSLEVSLNDYLRVSYIGFESYVEQIISKDITEFNIVLKESNNKLDEVVVVGYGETRRSDLTGSVSTIKSKDLQMQPTAQSFDQVLGGQLAGVQVSQTNGRPGVGAIVNIRGFTSVTGQNQPLYVIDGVPFIVDEAVPGDFASNVLGASGTFINTNPLLSINPADIESIDVLKDASSAAIYGSRAANGVVLVTTKKGKRNTKGQLNVNFNTAVQYVANEYDWMNAQQYREYITQVASQTDLLSGGDGSGNGNNFDSNVVLNDNRQYDPNNPALINPYFGTGDTDWGRAVRRSVAINKGLGISYSGGSQSSSYFVSFNFTDQEGMEKRNNLKNYSIRANINSDVTDNIKVGTNLSYAKNERAFSGLNFGNVAAGFQPSYDIFNPDGTYTTLTRYRNPNSIREVIINPLGEILGTNDTGGENFVGSAFAEITLLNDLKFKSEFSIGIANSTSSSYTPLALAEIRSSTSSTLRNSNSQAVNTTWTHTLNYTKTFNEKHNINALVGATFDQREIEQSGQGAGDFYNDEFNSIGSAGEINYAFENRQIGRLNSYISRINYDYDKRYYLTFTSRYDGSTKFGPDDQWGFFPSAAAMWRISNESFLENSETLSNLRLRASYGRTGNSNLPDFQFTNVYALFNTGSGPRTYAGQTVLQSSGIPNPILKWEGTDQLDIALEFGLFNQKLTGSVNYYNNKTNDLLLGSPISPTTGFNFQTQNIADVTNKGWEFEIGANFNFNELNWSSRFNIATNKNTLDALNGGSLTQFGNIDSVREGETLGVIFGYTVDGIFQTQQEIDDLNAAAPSGEYQDPRGMAPGNYRFLDINGDGEINGDDRQKIGSAVPDYFGGWNNTISYKGFELTANIQFLQGLEKVFLDRELDFLRPVLDRNNIVGALDNSWSPFNSAQENANATEEQFLLSTSRRSARERRSGDGHISSEVFDASYIRLKTLQLAYSMPQSVLDKLSIRNLRLTVTANNIWTNTDWPGLDPETVGGTGGVSAPSGSSINVASRGAQPLTSSVTFGINVGL